VYARHPKRSLREALEVAYDVWPPPRAVSPTQETKRPCGNGTAWSGAGSILRLSFGGVRLKAPLRAIGLLRSQRKRDAAGQEDDQETRWHPTTEESELQLSGHEQTHPLHIKWILVKTLRRLSEPDFEINPKCDGLNRGTLRRESAAARLPRRRSRSIEDFFADVTFCGLAGLRLGFASHFRLRLAGKARLFRLRKGNLTSRQGDPRPPSYCRNCCTKIVQRREMGLFTNP
jgi:hypothetical protein